VYQYDNILNQFMNQAQLTFTKTWWNTLKSIQRAWRVRA